MLVLLAFVAGTLVAAGGGGGTTDVPDPDTHVLTPENFDSIVNEWETGLVEFYAPWCGHCKSLAPEYAKAATELKPLGIPLGKVDADAHKALGTRFDVSGFPTLKVFRSGVAEAYNGPRTAAGIVDFMKKNSGPASVEMKDEGSIAAALDEDVPLFVFYGTDNKNFKAFMKAANKLRQSFKFAHALGGAAKPAVGTAPVIVALKKGADAVAFDGKIEGSVLDEDFAKFAHTVSLSRVQMHSGDLLEHASVAGKAVFRLFASDIVRNQVKKSKYHTNRLKKVDAAAGAAASGLVFSVGSKDDAGDFGSAPFGILSAEGLRYVPDAKEFTVEAAAAFVKAFAAGEVEPHIKSDPIPDPPTDEGVTVVVGKNFKDVVMSDDADVLVEFYAPWCGHCKSLAPVYSKLAKAVSKVTKEIVIAKIDATANEASHPAYSAKGFPTIFFAKRGQKTAPLSYDGPRTVKGFWKYLADETTSDSARTALLERKKSKKAKKDAAPAADDSADEL